MTDKIRARAGLTIGLAACLSVGGALAVALSSGLSAIAQLETSQQTEPSQDPRPGDVQSPEKATTSAQSTQGPNAAPKDPDTTPDTGDTQAPARQEDNQQIPQPSESNQNPPAGDDQSPEEATPNPQDTQGPNAAPDIQQNQAPESNESEESKARTENIVFVSTAEGAPTSEIEGESKRFGQIVGSGRLLVNQDDQVTGYYFIVSGLGPNQTLPYNLHSSKSRSTTTSCESDKGVPEDEAVGAVITPLSEIAPLRSTASGLGIVGSASSPVQLPNPVPLEEIGYLNIQANQDPTSGIVCANVPLKSVAFTPTQSGAPTSSEPSNNPPTQGPNTAPVPPTMNK